MWIRSQDRKAIINTDSCSEISYEGFPESMIIYETSGEPGKAVLGKYGCMNECLDVLADIWSHIGNGFVLYAMPERTDDADEEE